MSIYTAVSRGDIHRTSFNPNVQIPLYLGSGSCGALFDSYGLIGHLDEELAVFPAYAAKPYQRGDYERDADDDESADPRVVGLVVTCHWNLLV